ncbi:MAG: L-rhamnose mutarotase [Spirochaetia bacterium]|nr:L-rhamnose mutarotase [Spirochaetia bacterium]MCF7941572.1 L-rhamnose mutarotase [Spirochaetia bacterium]
MNRTAFKMKLAPGMKEEYRRRHDQLWPELRELLSESGVRDYSIFFDEETDTLFAVQKNIGDGGSQDLGSLPIVQKWWAFMADIMETHEDDSPVSVPLEELFHMD